MRAPHKFDPTRRSGDSRNNSALQNLSGMRNWSNDVMLRGMIGALKWLARKWDVDVNGAIYALHGVEYQIDEAWYKARDAVRAELALSSRVEALIEERDGRADQQTRGASVERGNEDVERAGGIRSSDLH